MFPILTTIILVAGLGVFAYSALNRFKLISLAKKSDIERLQNIPQRIWAVVKFGFAQYRMILREPLPGLFHAFVFWGFCILSIRTITMFGMGFSEGFHLPLLDPNSTVGGIYNLSKDVISGLVIAGVSLFLFRRIVTKPARITLSFEGILILGFIATLIITDLLFDGSEFNLSIWPEPLNKIVLESNYPKLWTAPLGIAVANVLKSWNLSQSVLHGINHVSFLIHIAIIVIFLNFLPYGKHFHVITALPNIFLRNLRPNGQLESINLEDENATSFGVEKFSDFSWKDVFDMYTCTECGRCTSQCPAHNTGKPLNPKKFLNDIKEFAYHNTAKLLSTDANISNEANQALVPGIIDPEVLWSCTTCRACEEACPVMIEYVDKIVEMRRNLVLMKGEFPTEVQATFKNMENNGNPWGIGFDQRADWAKGLNVPLLSEKPEVDVLYWVGCAGSFDDRNKKVSASVVKILQKAGVDFAILGPEETCTGDSARRIGNEYLYQTMAKQNIETMNKYKFKTVLAQCPHCFNTIKNEYPQFGGNFKVVHHADFINQLIQDGKIKPTKDLKSKITYHDSCYLGRYNNIYESPRDILKAIPGVQYEDVALSRDKGRCCGAGGGRMWMEEHTGTRVNHKRLEDLQTVHPETIASGCPFCLTMVRDATRDKEVNILTKDFAEILAEAID